MQSLWREEDAAQCANALALRVYSSRLLGGDPALVLHGGGNTSVKQQVVNLFGEAEDILYVKGSGWDLSTIEAAGFAPVRMKTLLQMAALESLSDSDMVNNQRAAMIDPSAPNPSVEAILHAVIPFTFVDHTHTDAVVTLTNTPDGEALIRDLYGDRVLIVPYVMPGFELARLIYQMTRDVDWSRIDGIVLMNHGLFSFADDARSAYEMHIQLVSEAEACLEQRGASLTLDAVAIQPDLLALARIRRAVSACHGQALVAHLNTDPLAVQFSNLDVVSLGNRGTLTPEHVIRTKRSPLFIEQDSEAELTQAVASYSEHYRTYFTRNHSEGQICLNPAPCYALWQGRGAISFGNSLKQAQVIRDINDHTFEAILKAEQLGGYQALDEATLFELEYWELEQAKLKKGGAAPALTGKVALVNAIDKDTASPVVAAIVKQLQGLGATVVVAESIDAVGVAIGSYGGLDLLVQFDGTDEPLLSAALPFLQLGIDPTLICIDARSEQGADSAGLIELPDAIRRVQLDSGLASGSADPGAVAALVGVLSDGSFSDQAVVKVMAQIRAQVKAH